MSFDIAFAPGVRALAIATDAHLKKSLHVSGARIAATIDAGVSWSPSFVYKDAEGFIVGIEVSEVIYPFSLRIAYAELINCSFPLRAIVVCPEEVFLAQPNQDDAEKLKAHGFGLWTVDKSGVVRERYRAILLSQVVTETDFAAVTDHFKRKSRERLRMAYEKYSQDPLSGLRDVTEGAEALANGILASALKSGLQLSKEQRRHGIAKKLDYILEQNVLGRGYAEIAGLRRYITKYRNQGHHAPKTEKDATKRIKTVRQAFLEGAAVVGDVQAAFPNARWS